MKNNISFVEINKLKTHEKVFKKRVLEIAKEISTLKKIKNPVVVDRETHIILDGHHRVAALKQLEAKYAPVFFVNYQDKNIRVHLRRKNILNNILKNSILAMGKSKNNFPRKTTKHYIYNRPKNINVNLDKLLI